MPRRASRPARTVDQPSNGPGWFSVGSGRLLDGMLISIICLALFLLNIGTMSILRPTEQGIEVRSDLVQPFRLPVPAYTEPVILCTSLVPGVPQYPVRFSGPHPSNDDPTVSWSLDRRHPIWVEPEQFCRVANVSSYDPFKKVFLVGRVSGGLSIITYEGDTVISRVWPTVSDLRSVMESKRERFGAVELQIFAYIDTPWERTLETIDFVRQAGVEDYSVIMQNSCIAHDDFQGTRPMSYASLQELIDCRDTDG